MSVDADACCADGAGWEDCELIGACIEGCSGDDEGGAVTGPCYSTCGAEAQQCVNDLTDSVEMTCAGVSSA